MITDKYGKTALHFAALFGGTAELIIDIIKAARPRGNQLMCQYRMTPRLFASLIKHLKNKDGLDDLVPAIVFCAIDLINLRDKKGRTALLTAVSSGRYKIAKILFENGADPTIMNTTGLTLYDVNVTPSLTGKKFYSMIKNTDFNHRYNHDSTLLHCAIKRWEVVVKKPLKRDADPSIQDKYGNTALHLAVMHHLSIEIIAHIIHAGETRLMGQDEMNYERGGGSSIGDDREINQSGACPIFINVQNRKGETALSLAISIERVQMVELFLRMGVSRTIKAVELEIEMIAKTDSEDSAKIIETLN